MNINNYRKSFDVENEVIIANNVNFNLILIIVFNFYICSKYLLLFFYINDMNPATFLHPIKIVH